MTTKTKMPARTTQGLRDILFDEIAELRGKDGNPQKSMAVANLAKQIINTAKVELEFRQVMAENEASGHAVDLSLGGLRLGT